MTGQSRLADVLERTLYNGFLSGLSLDGRTFFYVNPLQSRGGHAAPHAGPGRLLPAEHHAPAGVARPVPRDDLGHGRAAAPVRTRDASARHRRAATRSSCASRPATRGPAASTSRCVASGSDEWTLALRIPAWSREARVDGERVAPGTYAQLTRRWRPGDRVALELDVAPRLTAPNPRIDAVRGCLAVERGPLVYCFEEHDLPDGVDLADVRLAADPRLADAGPIETLAAMPGVTAEATVNSLDGWREVDYRDVRELGTPPAATPTRLLAVPYFAWANRSAGAMRVWVPAAGATA